MKHYARIPAGYFGSLTAWRRVVRGGDAGREDLAAACGTRVAQSFFKNDSVRVVLLQ
jgi:hypothetical protein